MKKTSSLPVFLLLMPGLASADISFNYPQQAHCQSKMSVIQLSGSRMRMDGETDGRKYTMLFDGMEDIITSLDHSSQSYHQMEVDEDALDYNADVMSSTGNFVGNQMNAIQAQMNKQCEELEKQGGSCAGMPDLASIMQNAQSMASGQKPMMEIKPSDKVQAVGGIACKTYDRYQNSMRSSEECYVETKDMTMPDKDKKYLLKNMKVMQHFVKSMTGFATKLMPGKDKVQAQSDPADSDFLLSQVCLSPDGNEAARIEVQISNATIAEGSFEIPPGYRVMNLKGDQ